MTTENFINDRHINFVANLVVGRVTQTIFEQMLRNSFDYYVFPFGYEYTHPDLANARQLGTISESFSKVSSQPDFRVYPRNFPNQVRFVEVKYRSTLNRNNIYNSAKSIYSNWPTTYLFIATPDNFYIDSCENICQNDGSIRLFNECDFINRINPRVVDSYHKILKGALGIEERAYQEDRLTQTVQEDPIISVVRKIIQI